MLVIYPQKILKYSVFIKEKSLFFQIILYFPDFNQDNPGKSSKNQQKIPDYFLIIPVSCRIFPIKKKSWKILQNIQENHQIIRIIQENIYGIIPYNFFYTKIICRFFQDIPWYLLIFQVFFFGHFIIWIRLFQIFSDYFKKRK